jgi:hypothetical protein
MKAAKKAKKKVIAATSDDDNDSATDSGSDHQSDADNDDVDEHGKSDDDDDDVTTTAPKRPAKKIATATAKKTKKKPSDSDNDSKDSDTDDNDEELDEIALAEEEEEADRKSGSITTSTPKATTATVGDEVEDEPKFSNEADAIQWWLRKKHLTITTINAASSPSSSTVAAGSSTSTPPVAATTTTRGSAGGVEAKSLTLALEYAPCRQFRDLSTRYHVADPIVRAVSSGLRVPTPIQSSCWPLGIAGLDVVGIASTGSGKTLAFLVPAYHMIAQRVKHQSTTSTSISSTSPTPSTTTTSSETKATVIEGNHNTLLADLASIADTERATGPLALVLAPTRELALQIMDVAKATGGACGMRMVGSH